MIGIATNVLLRLFLADVADQLRRAQAGFRTASEEGPVHINAIVLSEFAWTLAKGFKLSRAKVAVHRQDVLEADDIDVMLRPAAEAALASYRKGKADFFDYNLAGINAAVGCTTTLTFDRDALDHSQFSPVP
ncbi:MAG TPA: PIN domain-containing protein [Hyphomicrobiaceae bacterium]|nr:PIN domain-containing protein [Hyphomicrobiaceae bacterium]